MPFWNFHITKPQILLAIVFIHLRNALFILKSIHLSVKVDLCSRLVEVNGVSVLESSEEELELLLKTSIAHVIVLRQLPKETPQEEPSDPRQTLAPSDDQDLHTSAAETSCNAT